LRKSIDVGNQRRKERSKEVEIKKKKEATERRRNIGKKEEHKKEGGKIRREKFDIDPFGCGATGDDGGWSWRTEGKMTNRKTKEETRQKEGNGWTDGKKEEHGKEGEKTRRKNFDMHPFVCVVALVTMAGGRGGRRQRKHKEETRQKEGNGWTDGRKREEERRRRSRQKRKKKKKRDREREAKEKGTIITGERKERRKQ
jgi:hypothetical protein